jgi:hypothetical protein
MTYDETVMILGMIKEAYRAFYKDISKEEAKRAADLWSTMFADDDAKIVTEAVKSLMCTLKYPPTIADVKEKISLITQPEQLTEMEAWNQVRKAISYYNATENFQALPPILQKVVGGASQLRDWAVMDSETVNSVVQSNFMRSYKVKAAQAKEQSMLPESTRALISGLAERMAITDGGDR